MLRLFSFTQGFAGSTLGALRRREKGQTMAEYAVVLAVITPAIIAAISLLSGNVRSALERVANLVSG